MAWTRPARIRDRRGSLVAAAIALAVLSILPIAGRSATAAPVCATSSPGGASWAVTVCIDQPQGGQSLTGVASVSASVSTTGSPPVLRKLQFRLDGAYLLTDYVPPYGFQLPTTRWVDGGHTLSVVAMYDAFTSQAASVAVSYSNGTTTPPVNTNTFTPASGTSPEPGEPFVVAAVGDGAAGYSDSDAVASRIQQWDPNMFLYLGDVYQNGSPVEYYNWYGRSGTGPFGQLRSITNPTIGNHEYQLDAGATGYFDYWDNAPHYYSVNAGGWHFVSLDVNPNFAQYQPGTPQYSWLDQDLAASEAVRRCTIVFFHQPVFSQGAHGSNDYLVPLWSLMASRGVELVLSGHDHNYQRWVPMDGSGNPVADGIVQMVIGTGGSGSYAIPSPRDPRMAAGFDDGPGALRLELNAEGYAFRYESTNQGVVDSGSAACRDLPPDTTDPSAPTDLQASAVSPSQVDLSWTASTDDVGVTGYDVYRDGNLLTQIGPQTSFSDGTAVPATTYSYRVRARDAAGNVSDDSNQAGATTPAGSSLLFSDGFESGDLSNWTVAPRMTVQGTQVYSGIYAARAAATGGAGVFASKTLPSTSADLYFRERFRLASLGSTMNLLRVQTAGGTNIVTLFLSSSRNLMLRNDVAGSNVYSSTRPSLSAWHEVQLHLTVNGASGSVEVWLDGQRITELSRNLNLGTSPMGRVIVGDNVSGRTFDVAIDDVAVSPSLIG